MENEHQNVQNILKRTEGMAVKEVEATNLRRISKKKSVNLLLISQEIYSFRVGMNPGEMPLV